MSDQYRDSSVDRQNKNRKSFKGNTNDPIRVSFYDKDMTRVNDVTRSEANSIAALNPSQLFYYQDGNGYQRELLIEQVNKLKIIDALSNVPTCPTDPQLLGPPRVQIFGGMGMGAMANAIISPVSSSVIGFDIVNSGFNYATPPFANIVDEGGSGSGSKLLVQAQKYTGNDPQKGGLEIKNIVVLSPGDGYLSAPNGSLGGNGRIWKDIDEGYVKRDNGRYYIVPPGKEPPNLPLEDKFIPPLPTLPPRPTLPPGTIQPPQPTLPPGTIQPPTELDPNIISYPVVIEIEEIFVDNPGFGYEPGDTLEVISNDGTNKGAVLEPVINDRGEITQVKVAKPGIGFIDLPEIVINSLRGYNARLIPVLKVIPIADIPDPTVIPPGTQLISVVDCVGKIAPKDIFDIIPR